MRLADVIPGAPADAGEIEITDLAYDNRRVSPGALFFCVPGFTRDGHDYAPEAIDKGAPRPGDRIALSDTACIEAVHVDQPDVHLGLAVRLFGPKLRAVQLVWTDMYGRWPWDKHFDFDGLRQPVLGVRAQKA